MSERDYYNVWTYCSRPKCLREAVYAYIEEGVIVFRCPECRSVGL
jgi:hypothetical protein